MTTFQLLIVIFAFLALFALVAFMIFVTTKGIPSNLKTN
jgi:hypothetical protein